MQERRYATMEEFIGICLKATRKEETTLDELQAFYRALDLKLKNKIHFTKAYLTLASEGTFFKVKNILDEEENVVDKRICYQQGISECEVDYFLLQELDKNFIKSISEQINVYLDNIVASIN